MFDTDGNTKVDKEEFLVVQQLMSGNIPSKVSCCDYIILVFNSLKKKLISLLSLSRNIYYMLKAGITW